MTRILYFAHDLDDPAIWRRRAMLRAGGAEVDLVGFRRRQGPLPGQAHVIGRTRDARMGQRVGAVSRARIGLARRLRATERPDVILARNLEMLPLAVAAARRFARPERPRVVYEVLDIHRLMLRRDPVGRTLRRAESFWLERTDLVLVSSPGFRREYFAPVHPEGPPVHLVENRVVTGEAARMPAARPARTAPGAGRPLVLGWFGILRCAVSLRCLDAATRMMSGRVKVILRGRPAADAIPDFDARVAANPDLDYRGAYAYPDDLPRIYGEVDLSWLVDRYDAGRNSDWLLPNRFYESGMSGVPPVALAGTEVGREMSRLGIGLLLDGTEPGAVARALSDVTPARLDRLRQAQRAVSPSTWRSGTAEARSLVARLRGSGDVSAPAAEAPA
ncbi:MAG: glycosyl transferase [Roseicyclus sp.]